MSANIWNKQTIKLITTGGQITLLTFELNHSIAATGFIRPGSIFNITIIGGNHSIHF